MPLMSGSSSMFKISMSCFVDRWSLIAGHGIWSITFILHTSTMVGPIYDANALTDAFLKFPLPLFSFLHASSCCIRDNASLKHGGVS